MNNKNYSDQQELPLVSDRNISLKTTPMFQQYLLIKSEHEDCLLFFRMGDFYELFFEDAILASQKLDIALTSRGQYDGEPVPMCGVPYHAYVPYLQKLTKKGYKVAICEQTENPEDAKRRGGYKAIVKREVIRIVTPGTIVEDILLQPKHSNFLLALFSIKDFYGIAWIDISVGDFHTQYCTKKDLLMIISGIRPAEILVHNDIFDENEELENILKNNMNCTITPHLKNIINYQKVEKFLCNHFSVNSLDSFGKFSDPELIASWMLLEYLKLTQKDNMPPIRFPKSIKATENMKIDLFTRKSLEINTTLNGERKGSLLHSIDKTLTAAGARLLDKDISSPLTSINKINNRLNMLDGLYTNIEVKEKVREILKISPDVDRAKARILSGRGNPRDLVSIRVGIKSAKSIRKRLKSSSDKKISKYFGEILQSLKGSDNLLNLLEEAIDETVPNNINDGGYIRKGYSQNLDKLRLLKDKSRKILLNLEIKEKKVTGIPTIKIKYNNIIGHFFEVTQLQKEKLLKSKHSDRFIPRQSLKGVARFTTEELSKLSVSINNAAAQSIELEIRLFDELKENVDKYRENLSKISESLARVDVISALATLAIENKYVKPYIENSSTLEIKSGRHPSVEQSINNKGDIHFCSNNCSLNQKNRIWLLTGPNMAGKSTFLRQNAIIAILAQAGSFVPAEKANIGIVDMLFSRVGAADDLGSGRSTFMVEMVETAAILNQATKNSLVIMDEVGRGTSTYDGLSIAWSILEQLHDVNQCRTLFATHYHELTRLEEKLTALSCYTMQVKEWKNKIIFLYTVIKGKANGSYGLHVADLAGLPLKVIKRAEIVLKNFEKEYKNKINDKSFMEESDDKKNLPKYFDISKEIESLDPNSITPKNALELLYEYIDKIKEMNKKD